MSPALDAGATTDSTEARLSELFGSYKAEWLSESLFDLFTEPQYWPELTTDRPCVLVGGRGTGKTTVLRVMSYEGQYALRGRRRESASELPFFGLYARIDTNRVRAFTGPEVTDSVWIRAFAHYLNLTMVSQLLTFAQWHQVRTPHSVPLSPSACAEVAISLNLLPADGDTQDSLVAGVRLALLKLEAAINNIGETALEGLSMQKVPVDLLVGHLKLTVGDKPFFFLFDEYENFDEYQQRIVNTLVKHSGDGYSFKIGVREMGLRTRATLNPEEQLVSPADFVRLNIGDKLRGDDFRQFAASVCNSRLALVGTNEASALRVEDLLPRLTEDSEAELLGARELVETELAQRATGLSPDETEAFRRVRLRDQLTVVRWTEYHREPLALAIRELLRGDAKWHDRSNNYGYALLFTLQRGRGKGGIQKYYAGWDVLTAMGAGNIRYVLELVEQTLIAHLRAGQAIDTPVRAEVQTRAAQAVGRKNLTELEGLSVHGAQLTRLVLGLGRVFELFAGAPLGHTPEVNEFELIEPKSGGRDPSAAQEVDDLLKSAVMHLALLRYPGNKVSQAPSDTRDYDYRLHPVFSAAFVFSHRRKRKMQLQDPEILGLVRSHSRTIADIVRRQRSGNDIDLDEPLPDQLQLFQDYFRAE